MLQGRNLHRLLVVEDNRINAIVIAGFLEVGGYSFDIVTSGIEAIEAVRGGDYRVVLMDIRMPGMDGFEALRRIRALDGGKRDLSILAVTASLYQQHDDFFVAAGFDGYVPKPLDRLTLYGSIDQLIALDADRMGTRAVPPQDGFCGGAGAAVATTAGCPIE